MSFYEVIKAKFDLIWYDLLAGIQ